MVRGSAGEEVADKMAGGLGFSYATQPTGTFCTEWLVRPDHFACRTPQISCETVPKEVTCVVIPPP